MLLRKHRRGSIRCIGSVPRLDEAIQWANGKTVLILDQKDVPLATRVDKITEHKAEAYVMLIVSDFDDVQACHTMNKDVMMEVMIPNQQKVQLFSETDVPWANVIAFLGHVPPTERALYQAVHRNGASTVIGTSRNIDRDYHQRVINDRDGLRNDYQTLRSRGADLIETDLPREIGQLLYADDLFGENPIGPAFIRQ